MENDLKPRVLLADDHTSMRTAVEGILQPDFDVIGSVADGRAAFEAVHRFLPDILVLDVAMPVLNGTDVARRLKIEGCKTKVVFLSVSTDVDQVTACFAAGGNAYVSKMSILNDLIYAIKEVLAGRTFVSAEISFP
jgi:DNA-binding NarL/FixJ family response regulator